MYFHYYRLSKNWLDHSLKSVVSEHPWKINMLKGPKHLWNLYESTFTISLIIMRGYVSKISPLVKFEFLRVFVNTLTVDDKYPVSDCENLQFPYLNAIILKTKTFFWIFSSIDGSCMKFQTFWKKKMIVIANVLRILQTVNDLVGPLSKKCRFRTSFEGQQVRGSQSLAKSASEHFCHIFSSL